MNEGVCVHMEARRGRKNKNEKTGKEEANDEIS
jgi:hypothetical protein